MVAKKIQLIIQNGTKSNFFLVFLRRKSCLSCIFSLFDWLTVENRLVFFYLSAQLCRLPKQEPVSSLLLFQLRP